MAILRDNKRTVCITMDVWQGNGYSPDFSDDFFDVGGLPRVEDDTLDDVVYLVRDVDYCIDQAQDWANNRGDHYESDDVDTSDRCVHVVEL